MVKKIIEIIVVQVILLYKSPVTNEDFITSLVVIKR